MPHEKHGYDTAGVVNLDIRLHCCLVVAMPYLIDGHNLIARLPDIELDDPDDEAKLVIKLRGFVAKHKKKCTVVFDGGIPGGYSTMSNKSVSVIFASAIRSNADKVIKERIKKIPDPRNWTIVSSDNEVLNFAKSHKMQAQTSVQFMQTLNSRPRVQDNRGEALHIHVTKDEVDEWLDLFGADE